MPNKHKYTVERIIKFILPQRLQIILIYALSNINAHRRRRKALSLIPALKPLESKNSPQYIVSLTSYGKRLTDTAPVGIVTLLNQTVKPDRIILWVGNNDKENIPRVMKKLTEKGVEIRFCEDIRSYTKLIPALVNFPDDYIITADDDLFYPQNWFEQLMFEHKNNPRKIICHRAHGIKVDRNHNPIPYFKWDQCIEPNIYFGQTFPSQNENGNRPRLESVFPTGVGGILYPPKCFYKDITNKELFLKLSPFADDIWFWAMAVINKEYFGVESPYILVKDSHSQKLPLIDPRQEKGKNALWNYNWAENGNDKQLKAVIEQYPQLRDVLGKIEEEVISSNS